MSEDKRNKYLECGSLRTLAPGQRVRVKFPKDALSQEIVYKDAVVVHGSSKVGPCVVELESGGLLEINRVESLLVAGEEK